MSKDSYLPHIQHSHVRKPRCWGFRPIVINHFNTIVSNFRDWFRRIKIRMEPHGLTVGKPQTSAIVQLLAAQSFTNWGWMLSNFMEWYCPSVTYWIYAFKKCSLLQFNIRIFAIFEVKWLVIAGVSLVTGIALKSNSDVRDAIFEQCYLSKLVTNIEVSGKQKWVKKVLVTEKLEYNRPQNKNFRQRLLLYFSIS